MIEESHTQNKRGPKALPPPGRRTKRKATEVTLPVLANDGTARETINHLQGPFLKRMKRPKNGFGEIASANILAGLKETIAERNYSSCPSDDVKRNRPGPSSSSLTFLSESQRCKSEAEQAEVRKIKPENMADIKINDTYDRPRTPPAVAVPTSLAKSRHLPIYLRASSPALESSPGTTRLKKIPELNGGKQILPTWTSNDSVITKPTWTSNDSVITKQPVHLSEPKITNTCRRRRRRLSSMWLTHAESAAKKACSGLPEKRKERLFALLDMGDMSIRKELRTWGQRIPKWRDKGLDLKISVGKNGDILHRKSRLLRHEGYNVAAEVLDHFTRPVRSPEQSRAQGSGNDTGSSSDDNGHKHGNKRIRQQTSNTQSVLCGGFEKSALTANVRHYLTMQLQQQREEYQLYYQRREKLLKDRLQYENLQREQFWRSRFEKVQGETTRIQNKLQRATLILQQPQHMTQHTKLNVAPPDSANTANLAAFAESGGPAFFELQQRMRFAQAPPPERAPYQPYRPLASVSQSEYLALKRNQILNCALNLRRAWHANGHATL